MPVYDFKCPQCQEVKSDVQQPFSTPEPTCCGKSMVRQMCRVAFKVWNTDVMTQTGEENARMSGFHI